MPETKNASGLPSMATTAATASGLAKISPLGIGSSGAAGEQPVVKVLRQARTDALLRLAGAVGHADEIEPGCTG